MRPRRPSDGTIPTALPGPSSRTHAATTSSPRRTPTRTTWEGCARTGAPAWCSTSRLDLTLQPGNSIDASVTNLFYWNNVLHDVLYQYGFDEPAGNFQSNNYGNGGAAGDPVQADTQDGSDVNNAQFATPPDGVDPRMEMFRWLQGLSPRVIVSSPPAIAGTYSAGYAFFGAGTAGLAGNVVQALDPADGAGPTTTDACSPLTNPGAVFGNIAILDRGTCTFVVKVGHAQDAGATGAIVVNNAGDSVVNMLGIEPTIVIPSVFLGQSDGSAIVGQLGSGVSADLVSPAARDSSFDNGVVAHEYGHGVSNRLTGGPSNVNCLSALESRGMGEGWSDFQALVFTAMPGDLDTDARGVAPYLIGQPPHRRRHPQLPLQHRPRREPPHLRRYLEPELAARCRRGLGGVALGDVLVAGRPGRLRSRPLRGHRGQQRSAPARAGRHEAPAVQPDLRDRPRRAPGRPRRTRAAAPTSV